MTNTPWLPPAGRNEKLTSRCVLQRFSGRIPHIVFRQHQPTAFSHIFFHQSHPDNRSIGASHLQPCHVSGCHQIILLPRLARSEGVILHPPFSHEFCECPYQISTRPFTCPSSLYNHTACHLPQGVVAIHNAARVGVSKRRCQHQSRWSERR